MQEQGTDRRLIILAVFALIVIGVVAAILISRSGGDSDSGTASANGCEEVEAPRVGRKGLQAPKQTVKKGEKLTAVVETSCERCCNAPNRSVRMADVSSAVSCARRT